MTTETKPITAPALAPASDLDLPDALLAERLDRRIALARENLLGLQAEDGHWIGELEADSVLESEYILLLHFLGRSDEERVQKMARRIRRLQLPEGGWAIYHGGPPEVSASVKAYFVLKLLGDDPDDAHMAKARRVILDLGGIEATNTYTQIYLAIFGEYDWERCPAVPPEMVLLPAWFYFNLNEMSSWSRGIFVPLSIIWAYKPQCAIPEHAHIPELYVPETGETAAAGGGPWTRGWHFFFNRADQGIKLLERGRLKPLRRKALRAAEEWTRRRLDMSDGLGAIFPAIVNTVFAFRCLGYAPEDPAIQSQLAALEKLEVDLGDTLKIQPALSPVWDTAQGAGILAATGLEPDHEALQRAAEWLLSKEVRHPGDWQRKNGHSEVSGWYFEYANEFYPDCDDTAMVLTALARLSIVDPELRSQVDSARKRALRWLLSMQNPDGGWAAFDRGCDKELLKLIPFADHNAMIDPSWEDVTGRVLETLSLEGLSPDDRRIRRAIDFLDSRQCDDGTWYGRWGCNYIYGTWLALSGLSRFGVDMQEERYQRAAHWLRSRQNADGGWGETLQSYEEPALKGIGPSTAAQTAWALLGLFASGDYASDAVVSGVDFLLRMQLDDGSWDDEHWTGTGFPKVFYLKYHLYDDYFPLLAMARYRQALDG
jgi:squalene-hopene/tetraprenyl-beta-curcumene cyclase